MSFVIEAQQAEVHESTNRPSLKNGGGFAAGPSSLRVFGIGNLKSGWGQAMLVARLRRAPRLARSRSRTVHEKPNTTAIY